MRQPIIGELSPSLSADEVSYDPDTTTEGTDAIEALAVVLALIALTILFEKMKHAAEHAAGRALRPIVETLFGELTVLGFLSTVTYCLEQAGTFLALSRMISNNRDGGEGAEGETNEEEDDEVFELVETIHFGMFFVMVVFLVSVLAEVHHGLQSQKDWCQWDRACHDEAYIQYLIRENATMDEEHDAISSMRGFRGMAKRMLRFVLPYLRFLPFLRDKRKESLEDRIEFCSLREEFFKERSIDPPFAPSSKCSIGDHFNFGRYLTFAYAKKMAAVVEIDTTTWLFFAGGAVGYFLAIGFFGFSFKVLAWVWVLIGWIFHVLSINFEKYLLGIRDRFLAPEFFPKPKLRELSHNLSSLDDDSDMNGTEKEPLRHAKNGLQYQQIKLSEDLPMWCHIDLDELDRKRGRMNKLFFGPTPQNRQHALYLCGHDGPGFHVLCLRVMLLFSCIHSAKVSIVFVPMLARDESTTIFALIAYCVLAFIPSLAFTFNKKRLIASLIQVGSIGSFVLPQAVAASVREEKTSMAVRVLVIYFKLARMTKRFLANPSLFELDRADVYVLSLEEIAGLGRMFRLYFDHDGDNFLSGVDFQSIMSAVGVIITDEDTDELVRAMVKSVEADNIEVGGTTDGKLGLSTDVFIQWYINQLGDNDDKKECAEFLFGLFDDDNSGDITVLEFKQQLDKMDIGISHEEADELIQELDNDGNGVLCVKEIEEMIEHFYPLEFNLLENWDS